MKISADLTLAYAQHRFGVPPPPQWMGAKASETWLWMKRHSLRDKLWSWLVEDLTNRAFMLITVYSTIALWVISGIWLKSSSAAAGPVCLGTYIVVYLVIWYLLRGWCNHKGILFRPPRWSKNMIVRLAKWTPYGYTDRANSAEDLDMVDYHAGTFLAMLFSLTVYLALYFVGFLTFPPTLSCVILLATFLCWILSGITFLTDRFRIPILAIAIAILAYTSTWPEGDHTFDVVRAPPTVLPSPSKLASAEPRDFIAVAASGGGIHCL